MIYSSICTQDCHMQHLINVALNLTSKLCMFYRDALSFIKLTIELTLRRKFYFWIFWSCGYQSTGNSKSKTKKHNNWANIINSRDDSWKLAISIASSRVSAPITVRATCHPSNCLETVGQIRRKKTLVMLLVARALDDTSLQEKKNTKNVKRCRDGMPKSMQTR